MKIPSKSKPEKQKPCLIVIAGPTASGKSSLALWLADQLGGELICTDSMQVYRRMDIGTAKPSTEDRLRVPHHQLDIVDVDDSYSAGRYVQETTNVIQEVCSRSRIPILVGGSGLYIRSLIYGLSDIPKVSERQRAQVKRLHKYEGTISCWNRLEQLDPAEAKILHPNDTSRVLRALEVVMYTGKPFSSFRENKSPAEARYGLCGIGCKWPREELYQRINQRTVKMMESGWIEEVNSLLKDYSDNLKPLQSIGYREIIQFLKGKLERQDLVPAIQQRTRRYAKRQLTWFRRDSYIHWHPAYSRQQILKVVRVCLEKTKDNTA